MPHDPQKYLYDIVSSCDFLIEFTTGRSLADYASERGFRSAIERELQIIGEAVMQLDKVAPDLAAQITESRSIIGFRHVLVHGYDSLVPATVWEIIETRIAGLRDESQCLMVEMDNGSA